MSGLPADTFVTRSDRLQHVERLYHAALARRQSDRASFLDEACAGDETLRREVESLLAYAADADDFLASPAVDLLATGNAPANPLPRALMGQRLGPYEITSLIGSGGMGQVYRARDTKLGRDVAIKILPDAFLDDADRRARFEREARVLASLNHPHIGAIYGFEDRDGIHALVLELIDGATLADRLRSGARPLREALTIARQIAEALEAAHEKGIVHRDLKPGNVLLQGVASERREGRISPTGDSSVRGIDDVVAKVVDFGLAKAGDDRDFDLTYLPTLNPGGSSNGVVFGTVSYMSPEQARGKPVDRRTDIWAFGCVLYEMLTGHKAFVGETMSDTIAAVLEHQPDWTAFPHTTPPPIRRLVQRCLEKDPKRRLHDIADARIEIDDLLREPALADSSVWATPPYAGAVRRARVASALALGAVAAAVVALVWWSRTNSPAVPAASTARLMISLPEGASLEKGRFPPLALSPDGKLLVYAAAENGGRTNLFLRALDDVIARRIPGTDGASTPFFSHDGRWLAFYANGVLKKVSVTGGVPLTICDAPPVWSASWGEGDRIVFATMLTGSGLWAVSANGGDPTQITTPAEGETQHGYPQLLPGGARVLFSVRRDNAWRLALLDLNGRGHRLLGNGRVVGEGAQYLRTGHVVYAQAGGIVATPFNPSAGTLDQPPVPLLERVETSSFGGSYFAFAAETGTLVYLPTSGIVASRTLVRVDRDGRAAPLVEAHAAYEHPTLSRDGRRLAVTIAAESGRDIWIVDLERTTRVRFTAGGTSAFPVWEPAGSRLAFQSTASGPWNLFWKPFDGRSEAEPLLALSEAASPRWPNTGASLLPGTLPTLSGAGPQFPGSWSPDGSLLAFHERKPSGERDIWIVSPGKDPVPFLLTPFDERQPQFSPDGKWLAYVSDESGRSDVYVQPYPGPGGKWLVSTDGGVDPVWSRDGHELLYRHDEQLMAVSVVSGSDFSYSRPRPLFEARIVAGDNSPNYDISPDGKWFVMLRSDREPPPEELHLVLNWFTEVRARTAVTERGQ